MSNIHIRHSRVYRNVDEHRRPFVFASSHFDKSLSRRCSYGIILFHRGRQRETGKRAGIPPLPYSRG